MKDKVIIVGAFHEVIELCEDCGFEIVGIIDTLPDDTFMDYPVLGTDADAKSIREIHPDSKIVISPDSPKLKQKLGDYYKSVGFSFETVVSPLARISRSAKIGEGVIIQSGVNISSAATIGRLCKLNFNVNVMHDVVIGDYSVLAANAVVLGRASVGMRTYLGANSTVMPDAVVADDTKVSPTSLID